MTAERVERMHRVPGRERRRREHQSHFQEFAQCRQVCPSENFFFYDPPTPDIYTLSLHDALPISSFWQAAITAAAPMVSSTAVFFISVLYEGVVGPTI